MSIAYASEQLAQRASSSQGLGFARLAEALHREQREDEAIGLLSEGVRRHPGYVAGRLLLARLYIEAGRAMEARGELEAVLQIDGRCPQARKQLGEILSQMQSHGESAHHFGLLAAMEPWDLEFQEAYHRSLGQSGRGASPAGAGGQSSGGVAEFNINEVSEFLPKDEAPLDLGLEPGSATIVAEPMPMDILREESAPAPTAEKTETPAPITGQDVESRLDSFFGFEDAPPPTASQIIGKASETTGIYKPPAEENSITGAETASAAERVEGEDIARRLDDIFASEPGASDTAVSTTAVESVEGEDIARRLDDLFTPKTGEGERPGTGTEAVEAAALKEAAGTTAEPASPVTGEDVAQQLDKIFTPDAGLPQEEPVVSGDDVARQLDHLFPSEAESAPSGADSTIQPRLAGLDEHTIALPAMRAEAPAAEIAPQSVVDATVDADVGAESVVETEDLHPARETSLYDGEPPREGSDTVVGDDISQRLDQLFGAEEGSGTQLAASANDPGTSETATIDLAATMAVERRTDDTETSDISGDDVKERLTQIFGPEGEASQTQGLSRSQVFGSEATQPTDSAMAPMLPMEEEAEAEGDASAEPPNVATVTLAEIYFQQGLKEQALQIYRQLLERDPGNDTARKRIEEIEASRPEDDAKGGEGDRRSPRPGLKVPRRKK